MATFKTFEDIEAWKRGHQVVLSIYNLNNTTKLKRDFGLSDQMRRSAISITSNIAEGFDRNGPREFIYFLGISKASASELRSQLLIAKDLNYIQNEDFARLNRELIELGKMLAGLINYLKSRAQLTTKN